MFVFLSTNRNNNQKYRVWGTGNQDNYWKFLPFPKDKRQKIPNTITCLINEKGQINEKAHNSNVHPAHFEPNKRASRANRYEIA